HFFRQDVHHPLPGTGSRTRDHKEGSRTEKTNHAETILRGFPNASPLIVLSKLGRLDLLLEPRPDIEVVVPQAVLDEVMRGEPDDPAVSLVPEAVADWMRVIESNQPTPFRGPAAGFQPARLGAGGTPLAGSLP
ncbi:MAG: hypothetical protein ACLQU5_13090, partial [Isosphaeraceae bacterium]